MGRMARPMRDSKMTAAGRGLRIDWCVYAPDPGEFLLAASPQSLNPAGLSCSNLFQRIADSARGSARARGQCCVCACESGRHHLRLPESPVSFPGP